MVMVMRKNDDNEDGYDREKNIMMIVKMRMIKMVMVKIEEINNTPLSFPPPSPLPLYAKTRDWHCHPSWHSARPRRNKGSTGCVSLSLQGSEVTADASQVPRRE